MRTVSIRCFFLTALLTLTACGTLDGVRQAGVSAADTQQYREQIGVILDQARDSESPARDLLYLQASMLLQDIDEIDWARNLLGSVDPDMLFGDEYINYILTYSDIALGDDAYFLAQRILTNQRLEQQLLQQPPEVVETLRTRRAELFELLGEAANSVAERVSLNGMLESGEQKDLNQDALWHTMMTIPAEQLRQLSDREYNPILKGWYSLGIISKNNDSDLQMQHSRITDWIQSWPDHPASVRLPSDLRLLKQLVDDQPQQIALLLPLSGDLRRTGQAVRDGFFAAYYQARLRGTYTPIVRIYDSNVSDINEIYDLAVNQGAELIIGPIDPAVGSRKLSDLNTRLALPVPTLALNYIDSPYGYAENLFQFSFSREIEAQHIAQRAWLEGHRNAAVLAPETENGRRSTNAFIAEWEALGGQIVADTPYNSELFDFTDTIDLALLRDESRERHKSLRRLLGGSLQFEPRMRHDVDMIFLEAQPQQAHQLKATLNAALAEALPVYATSRIYRGQSDPKNDRILKGIRFSTLPWYFDNFSNEKSSVSEHAKPDARYNFLYALGVDTYKLYPRLKQLESIPGVRFPGTTGVLEMTSDRKIEQQQVWAHMVEGMAVQLPTVVSDTFTEPGTYME